MWYLQSLFSIHNSISWSNPLAYLSYYMVLFCLSIHLVVGVLFVCKMFVGYFWSVIIGKTCNDFPPWTYLYIRYAYGSLIHCMCRALLVITITIRFCDGECGVNGVLNTTRILRNKYQLLRCMYVTFGSLYSVQNK